MSNPIFSVVISTLPSSQSWLVPCVDSIEKSSSDFEIVIVHHKSDDFPPLSFKNNKNVKLVELDQDIEPTHFSYAYNKGLQHTSGSYLIAMNDDTVVSPGWLDAMRTGMAAFEAEHGIPVGIVGPVSNCVGGIQSVRVDGISRSPTYEDIIAVSEVVKKNHDGLLLGSQFISGFCQMFRRSFYDSMRTGIEFFDTRLENGAEDNLICYRAVISGYINAVIGEVFVFHHGSRTMDRVAGNNGRGVMQLFNYYKIANSEYTPPAKLASACRVRLMTEDHKSIFMKALEQHVKIADVVVLVNDRSLIWPADEIDKLVEAHGTPVKIHTFDAGHDENRDRQKLVSMAHDEDATWFLSFDADEIFEDKFDRAYAQRLINPPRPDIMTYMFHWYTFWDESCTSWRVDSTFGGMHGGRLSRLLPNYTIKKTASGLHMGNIPCQQLLDSARVTSVRIKHYGYNTEAERQRKYEFYERIDTVKNPTEVGNVDYSHLVPTVYQAAKYYETSGVTIGTIVRNEELRLHNFLMELWSFADEMIFCDTGSTDKTVELLEYFGAKVLSYEEETGEKWDLNRLDLAKARNLIFPHIKTEWFWHHDIDEIYVREIKRPHPLAAIRRMLDKPSIDGYQFMFRNHHAHTEFVVSQSTRLMRKPQTWFYSGYVHETVDEAATDKKIVLSSIVMDHNGWLASGETIKNKLKTYLRGNLRMVQDYPNDPRGWFNAGLHLFDAHYDNAGITFVGQALRLKPDFAAALKELIARGAMSLRKQAINLSELSGRGHPFNDYGVELANVLGPLAPSGDELIRYPEHVDEVLAEPEFRGIAVKIIGLEELQSKKGSA